MIGIEVIDEELTEDEAKELVENMIGACEGYDKFHVHIHVNEYITDYTLRWR